MSSPQMTRMFGFLPSCRRLADTFWLWAATAEDLSAAAAGRAIAAGSAEASDFGMNCRCPDAASQPPSAPTASTATVEKVDPIRMMGTP